MAISLSATCPKCAADIELKQADIDGLDDLIEDERSDAVADYKDDQGIDDPRVDVDILTRGQRPLFELAIALRQGDMAEAELLLDRIAAELGDGAVEEVQQGRFSPLARAA